MLRARSLALFRLSIYGNLRSRIKKYSKSSSKDLTVSLPLKTFNRENKYLFGKLLDDSNVRKKKKHSKEVTLVSANYTTSAAIPSIPPLLHLHNATFSNNAVSVNVVATGNNSSKTDYKLKVVAVHKKMASQISSSQGRNPLLFRNSKLHNYYLKKSKVENLAINLRDNSPEPIIISPSKHLGPSKQKSVTNLTSNSIVNGLKSGIERTLKVQLYQAESNCKNLSCPISDHKDLGNSESTSKQLPRSASVYKNTNVSEPKRAGAVKLSTLKSNKSKPFEDLIENHSPTNLNKALKSSTADNGKVLKVSDTAQNANVGNLKPHCENLSVMKTVTNSEPEESKNKLPPVKIYHSSLESAETISLQKNEVIADSGETWLERVVEHSSFKPFSVNTNHLHGNEVLSEKGGKGPDIDIKLDHSAPNINYLHDGEVITDNSEKGTEPIVELHSSQPSPAITLHDSEIISENAEKGMQPDVEIKRDIPPPNSNYLHDCQVISDIGEEASENIGESNGNSSPNNFSMHDSRVKCDNGEKGSEPIIESFSQHFSSVVTHDKSSPDTINLLDSEVKSDNSEKVLQSIVESYSTPHLSPAVSHDNSSINRSNMSCDIVQEENNVCSNNEEILNPKLSSLNCNDAPSVESNMKVNQTSCILKCDSAERFVNSDEHNSSRSFNALTNGSGVQQSEVVAQKTCEYFKNSVKSNRARRLHFSNGHSELLNNPNISLPNRCKITNNSSKQQHQNKMLPAVSPALHQNKGVNGDCIPIHSLESTNPAQSNNTTENFLCKNIRSHKIGTRLNIRNSTKGIIGQSKQNWMKKLFYSHVSSDYSHFPQSTMTSKASSTSNDMNNLTIQRKIERVDISKEPTNTISLEPSNNNCLPTAKIDLLTQKSTQLQTKSTPDLNMINSQTVKNEKGNTPRNDSCKELKMDVSNKTHKISKKTVKEPTKKKSDQKGLLNSNFRHEVMERVMSPPKQCCPSHIIKSTMNVMSSEKSPLYVSDQSQINAKLAVKEPTQSLIPTSGVPEINTVPTAEQMEVTISLQSSKKFPTDCVGSQTINKATLKESHELPKAHPSHFCVINDCQTVWGGSWEGTVNYDPLDDAVAKDNFNFVSQTSNNKGKIKKPHESPKQPTSHLNVINDSQSVWGETSIEPLLSLGKTSSDINVIDTQAVTVEERPKFPDESHLKLKKRKEIVMHPPQLTRSSSIDASMSNVECKKPTKNPFDLNTNNVLSSIHKIVLENSVESERKSSLHFLNNNNYLLPINNADIDKVTITSSSKTHSFVDQKPPDVRLHIKTNKSTSSAISNDSNNALKSAKSGSPVVNGQIIPPKINACNDISEPLKMEQNKPIILSEKTLPLNNASNRKNTNILQSNYVESGGKTQLGPNHMRYAKNNAIDLFADCGSNISFAKTSPADSNLEKHKNHINGGVVKLHHEPLTNDDLRNDDSSEQICNIMNTTDSSTMKSKNIDYVKMSEVIVPSYSTKDPRKIQITDGSTGALIDSKITRGSNNPVSTTLNYLAEKYKSGCEIDDDMPIEKPDLNVPQSITHVYNNLVLKDGLRRQPKEQQVSTNNVKSILSEAFKTTDYNIAQRKIHTEAHLQSRAKFKDYSGLVSSGLHQNVTTLKKMDLLGGTLPNSKITHLRSSISGSKFQTMVTSSSRVMLECSHKTDITFNELQLNSDISIDYGTGPSTAECSDTKEIVFTQLPEIPVNNETVVQVIPMVRDFGKPLKRNKKKFRFRNAGVNINTNKNRGIQAKRDIGSTNEQHKLYMVCIDLLNTKQFSLVAIEEIVKFGSLKVKEKWFGLINAGISKILFINKHKPFSTWQVVGIPFGNAFSILRVDNSHKPNYLSSHDFSTNREKGNDDNIAQNTKDRPLNIEGMINISSDSSNKNSRDQENLSTEIEYSVTRTPNPWENEGSENKIADSQEDKRVQRIRKSLQTTVSDAPEMLHTVHVDIQLINAAINDTTKTFSTPGSSSSEERPKVEIVTAAESKTVPKASSGNELEDPNIQIATAVKDGAVIPGKSVQDAEWPEVHYFKDAQKQRIPPAGPVLEEWPDIQFVATAKKGTAATLLTESSIKQYIEAYKQSQDAQHLNVGKYEIAAAIPLASGTAGKESSDVQSVMNEKNETSAAIPSANAIEDEEHSDVQRVMSAKNETSATILSTSAIEDEDHSDVQPVMSAKNKTSAAIPLASGTADKESSDVQSVMNEKNETSAEIPSASAIEDEEHSDVQPVMSAKNETSAAIPSASAIEDEEHSDMQPVMSAKNETFAAIPLASGTAGRESPDVQSITNEKNETSAAIPSASDIEDEEHSEVQPVMSAKSETFAAIPSASAVEDEEHSDMQPVKSAKNETSASIPSASALEDEDVQPVISEKIQAAAAITLADAITDESSDGQHVISEKIEAAATITSAGAITDESSDVQHVMREKIEAAATIPSAGAIADEESIDVQPVKKIETAATISSAGAITDEESSDVQHVMSEKIDTAATIPSVGAKTDEVSSNVQHLMNEKIKNAATITSAVANTDKESSDVQPVMSANSETAATLSLTVDESCDMHPVMSANSKTAATMSKTVTKESPYLGIVKTAVHETAQQVVANDTAAILTANRQVDEERAKLRLATTETNKSNTKHLTISNVNRENIQLARDLTNTNVPTLFNVNRQTPSALQLVTNENTSPIINKCDIIGSSQTLSEFNNKDVQINSKVKNVDYHEPSNNLVPHKIYRDATTVIRSSNLDETSRNIIKENKPDILKLPQSHLSQQTACKNEVKEDTLRQPQSDLSQPTAGKNKVKEDTLRQTQSHLSQQTAGINEVEGNTLRQSQNHLSQQTAGKNEVKYDTLRQSESHLSQQPAGKNEVKEDTLRQSQSHLSQLTAGKNEVKEDTLRQMPSHLSEQTAGKNEIKEDLLGQRQSYLSLKTVGKNEIEEYTLRQVQKQLSQWTAHKNEVKEDALRQMQSHLSLQTAGTDEVKEDALGQMQSNLSQQTAGKNEVKDTLRQLQSHLSQQTAGKNEVKEDTLRQMPSHLSQQSAGKNEIKEDVLEHRQSHLTQKTVGKNDIEEYTLRQVQKQLSQWTAHKNEVKEDALRQMQSNLSQQTAGKNEVKDTLRQLQSHLSQQIAGKNEVKGDTLKQMPSHLSQQSGDKNEVKRDALKMPQYNLSQLTARKQEVNHDTLKLRENNLSGLTAGKNELKKDTLKLEQNNSSQLIHDVKQDSLKLPQNNLSHLTASKNEIEPDSSTLPQYNLTHLTGSTDKLAENNLLQLITGKHEINQDAMNLSRKKSFDQTAGKNEVNDTQKTVQNNLSQQTASKLEFKQASLKLPENTFSELTAGKNEAKQNALKLTQNLSQVINKVEQDTLKLRQNNASQLNADKNETKKDALKFKTNNFSASKTPIPVIETISPDKSQVPIKNETKKDALKVKQNNLSELTASKTSVPAIETVSPDKSQMPTGNTDFAVNDSTVLPSLDNYFINEAKDTAKHNDTKVPTAIKVAELSPRKERVKIPPKLSKTVFPKVSSTSGLLLNVSQGSEIKQDTAVNLDQYNLKTRSKLPPRSNRRKKNFLSYKTLNNDMKFKTAKRDPNIINMSKKNQRRDVVQYPQNTIDKNVLSYKTFNNDIKFKTAKRDPKIVNTSKEIPRGGVVEYPQKKTVNYISKLTPSKISISDNIQYLFKNQPEETGGLPSAVQPFSSIFGEVSTSYFQEKGSSQKEADLLKNAISPKARKGVRKEQEGSEIDRQHKTKGVEVPISETVDSKGKVLNEFSMSNRKAEIESNKTYPPKSLESSSNISHEINKNADTQVSTDAPVYRVNDMIPDHVPKFGTLNVPLHKRVTKSDTRIEVGPLTIILDETSIKQFLTHKNPALNKPAVFTESKPFQKDPKSSENIYQVMKSDLMLQVPKVSKSELEEISQEDLDKLVDSINVNFESKTHFQAITTKEPLADESHLTGQQKLSLQKATKVSPIESEYKKRVTSLTIAEITGSELSRLTEFPLRNAERTTFGYRVPIGGITSISSDFGELKKEVLAYPSVSKILNMTMSESSRAALKLWKSKQIAKLGEDGFLEFYKALLTRGTEFHSCIQNHLLGNPPDSELTVDDSVQRCMNSLATVLPHVSSVAAVESSVAHANLAYRGVIDAVAKFKGKPVLIEWKRSDKPKPFLRSTFDAPLQLAAYIGAINFDNNYRFQVDGGLLVVAYSDGSPADIFELSMSQCDAYWKIWLDRLTKYHSSQHQMNEIDSS